MAERLGTGLQNPLQRFESASDLEIRKPLKFRGFFYELNLGLLTRYYYDRIPIRGIQTLSGINTNHGLIRNISFKTAPSD